MCYPVVVSNLICGFPFAAWVGGHGDKEAPLDADYGDVLSFYRQLRSQLTTRDFFFVMNGDWIDGTGLAINGDPSYLIPILERMPWDAVNCGNHELYRKDVIDYASRPAGWIDWWDPKYLTSNIVYTSNQKTVGNQYRLLKGPTSTVLTFGFLYNMKDNDSTVTVHEVGSVVEQPWFTNALQTPGVDAILVLAHMDHDDALISVILTKIRSVLGPNMPVQFVAGHTHIRGVHNPDASSSSFEAGRYLDTVGFVSFPRRDTLAAAPAGSNTTSLFQHTFLDASRGVLENVLNGPTLGTNEGAELSSFIHRTQTELGLREIVGCVPERLYFNKTIAASNSIWGIFERELVPHLFGDFDVVMMHTTLARYDLFPGDIILDEVIGMMPFNETVFKFSGIPLDILIQLNKTANSQVVDYMPALPRFTFAPAKPLPSFDANSTILENNTSEELYNLITSEFVVRALQTELQKLYPQISAPVSMHTGVLDVWLRFFGEEHLCQTPQQGSHRPSPHPNHNNGTGMPHIGFTVPDDEKDQARLIFSVVALAMLGLLGSIYVWQRGATYKRDNMARERIILEAQREFEGEEESDDDFDRELL